MFIEVSIMHRGQRPQDVVSQNLYMNQGKNWRRGTI